jgi:hypothetical protein
MMNSIIKNKLIKVRLPAFVSCIFIFFLAGCPQREPEWDKCVQDCGGVIAAKLPNTSSEAPPNVTDNIVVYLDTSKSMRGYVAPRDGKNFAVSENGQTIYTKTLLELKNAAGLISPDYSVSLRRVTKQLSDPAFNALEISAGAIKRDEIYQGDDTDLALAVKSFSQNLKANDSGPPRFHILVTDGVQSSAGCTQNSDPRCLKEQILSLIGKKEANWSAAIIGLRSEFDGLVYSEVLPGTSFDYQSGKLLSGFRPFYLYIFSANQFELNKFVDSLKENLLKLKPRDVKDGDFLREFPVTDDYGRYLNGNVTADSKTDESGSILTLTPSKAPDENPAFTIKVSTDTEESGATRFAVTASLPWKQSAELLGTKSELSEIIKWELVQCSEFPEDSRYPFIRKLDDVEYAEDGKVTLHLETGWTKDVGTRGWRTAVLIGRINTDKAAPKWIAGWSTQTDMNPRDASKTLNLIESLGNLWRNAAIQKQVVARIYLKVGEL